MIRNFRVILFLLVFSPVFPGGDLHAYEAFFTHVLDGDSFRVRQGRKVHTIRLYGIDCPEYRQPGWTQAKHFTRQMTGKERLSIHPMDVDRYGRTVALVYVQGKLLNAELIRQGLAWHYQRYCRAQPLCREFKHLERSARSDKRGIWRKTKPTPPWVWKRNKR